MEEVVGRLKVVLFHNDDNLYSVIKIKVNDETDSKYLTLTGNFPIPNDTTDYKYRGEYTTHPRYGAQFIVSEYEELLPNSEEAIIKYLSSPLFPKIGVKTATKIYNELGKNTIEIIKRNPEVLDYLVSDEQKNIIVSKLSEDSYFDEAVKEFVTQGLSLKMLLKIQSVYQEKMIQVIKENPYKLVEEIDGIGFKIADDFALNIGFEKSDERRIKACLVYCASTICFNESDTYTDEKTLFKEFDKIIPGIDEISKKYFLDMVISEGKIYREEDKIFPMAQYVAEKENARILSKFIKRIINDYGEDKILKVIDRIEEKIGITYDDVQKEAIINCMNSGLSIICGGPGTGKTTIVKAIIEVYKELFANSDIFVCAPTGRASKRLTEVVGIKATTIHSLLKWDLHSNTFSVNENNPLNGHLLIVDEFSMVDNYLMHQLLRASENLGQIIFIGDEDQLPSVGPGNVLKDLIDSDLINMIRLTKIYRQSEKSNIIKLAHHIKNNEDISLDFDDDVTFYSTNDYNIKRVLLEYIKKAENNGYSRDDIQVIAPMYQGLNGIEILNEQLQNYFNPSDDIKKELRVGKVIYREEDKILQLKNQNEDNVYNGDIGTLIDLDLGNNVSSSKLTVGYDDSIVEYSSKDFVNICHAYCISIHKSQGSEYPLIILPISFGYQRMLAKNLIYTAITRAKQKLIIIGDYNAFLYGISNTKYKVRKTTLKEKLIYYVNPF